jgi:hypothetical protein
MEFKLLRKTHLIKLNFILISILFFSSCYLIPCNLDSGLDELNIEQEDNFFIGEYIVEKSINNSFKTNDIIIKLKKDGFIEMNNMPIEIFNFMKTGEKVSLKGTWRQNFIKDRQVDRYYLPTDLEFVKKRDTKASIMTMKIYTKNNKPVLFLEFGDPDNCTAIRFIKK